mmetsp:Transcript_1884/g.1684  ORF Transcript_1884/g.1684 Transcript_1884/m.1684 type:complete len:239 (+) Transcript_1884:11-727(+)
MVKGRKIRKKQAEETSKTNEVEEEIVEEDEGLYIQLDVALLLPTDEEELVPAMKVPILLNGDVDFPLLMTKLKSLGYPLESSFAYYFSKDLALYVSCGHDPLPKFYHIPKTEYDESCTLRLKFKTGLRSEYCDNTKAESGSKAQKRTKERKIGFIIEKVSLWRKLYNGIPDHTGKTVRYSLEEAANLVGVSKKSLDDYLSQLRKGRKFGFDFNKNKDEKVGTLRTFVKDKASTRGYKD